MVQKMAKNLDEIAKKNFNQKKVLDEITRLWMKIKL